MTTVIAFIIIFGALVFFHEAGHFYFAKRAGILCREFAIGFGPKILSFKKNETLYTIRLLPIGGYVRMAGEDQEMLDLKAGQRVGLIFNDKEQVEKIVLNGKNRYPNIRLIEVESADLDHDLIIKGYEEEDDETLKTFSLMKEAVIVEDQVETQIAPWDRQFASKSLGKRAMTIFAGPMMNFVLAIVIFTILAIIQGVPTNDPILGKLTNDGAAKQAGLHTGDTVISIDGSEISSWEDIVDVIQKHPGEELMFTIERNNQTKDIAVTPKAEKEGEKEVGRIGVLNPVEKSPLKVATYGVQQTYQWTIEIFRMLGKLVTGQFSIDMLSGPVGIYKSTEVVAKSGVLYLMKWGALLSINLGIMNLLPIPALDGGRLLFFGVEALRGKPIDRQKEGMVHFIGFALLMLLMIIVTWNDIQRFFL
ncbi:RIP metalloprotease RseP [Heyndrickxia oleronia]|uniref:Zinc metalloprotease n=1 Tax=Heyndrickxia oleronia TaxID=38875 RepID=A0A8E2LHQ5_9BACI|nr:RIP metalloprotease RseP [Heyndrickxia oleronia]MCM3454148.1 RIP metalloprotease RseP [Heyndrickxia oleronia]MDH5161227.1 RIP metalloprotease RseP [Heyndrickxia oleronia]MEC1376198.1 RIP metalloprotease RseP [Heyndrickxia oleronia]OOP70384.1 RIP metalloprotease RseP [Heyndrickxia oleronia]QQZ03188.1 RIP metalloprotease RseP [Heyndrickxia oleronia]